MVAQLASSIFSTGAKNEFATLDVYKSSGEELVNALPVNLKDAMDIFASIKIKAGDFDVLGTAKSLSKTVVGDYLKDTANGLGLKMSDMGPAILEKTTTLLEKTPPQAQALMCSIGDYTNKASVFDMSRVVKLGYALSNVKDVNSAIRVVNQNQNSALLSNIIGEASDTGVGGVFTSLKKVIDDNGIVSKVIKTALPFVMKNSDVSLLRELTSGSIGKIINSLSPGFTKSFSSVFNPQYKYNFTNVASFNTIVDSFDKISTTWDKAKQNGEDIYGIFNLLSGTKEFKTLLGSGVAYVMSEVQDEQKKQRAQAHALSKIYAESTVQNQIKRYFPGLILTGDYNKRSIKDQTTDIQVLGRQLRPFAA